MKALSSFTKSTRHFLSDTLNLSNLLEGACLFTGDVVSVYNNILRREGTETVIKNFKDNMALVPENSPSPLF